MNNDSTHQTQWSKLDIAGSSTTENHARPTFTNPDRSAHFYEQMPLLQKSGAIALIALVTVGAMWLTRALTIFLSHSEGIQSVTAGLAALMVGVVLFPAALFGVPLLGARSARSFRMVSTGADSQIAVRAGVVAVLIWICLGSIIEGLSR